MPTLPITTPTPTIVIRIRAVAARAAFFPVPPSYVADIYAADGAKLHTAARRNTQREALQAARKLAAKHGYVVTNTKEN